eukprot:TRINITY_DN3419_c3_g1_i1.p1 TRINITY_DN3419_c3_g1~~TRINITY_DN3419_c3_g1_i1.p1  ORF type:complete len:1505 (+),score=437.29 TRINITY_DN3419_c3_g1_i1:63-4577(+)
MALRRCHVLACAVTLAAAGSKPDQPIVRPNIGFNMYLGALYNAGLELPVSAFLCSEELVAQHTKRMDTPYMTQEYVKDDKRSSKLDLLNVKGEMEIHMQTSFKLDIKGSAEYLIDKQKTNNEVRMSFKSEVHTKTDMLDVFNQDLATQLNRQAIKVSTHVVTGIVWGQRTIATFVAKVDDDREKQDIAGKFDAALQAGTFSGKLKAELTMKSQESDGKISYSTKIFADKIPEEEFPTTLNETMAFVKTTHLGMVGDGVPLSYILTPLTQLDSQGAQLIAEIEDQYVVEARAVFDKLEESDILLEELLQIDYVGNRAWFDEAAWYQKLFLSWKAFFLQRLGNAVAEARFGDIGADIPAKIGEYWKSEWNHDTISGQVEYYQGVIRSWQASLVALVRSGVQVATSAADITGATLDLSYDKTYLLVVVDNGGRFGVGELRNFATYANSKDAAEGDGDEATGSRCTMRVESGTNDKRCVEKIKMVAVHFESYCRVLCPPHFCFKHSRDPAKPAVRACRTKLQPDGTAEPGDCKVDEDEAREQKCWLRPDPDPASKGMVRQAFTEEWCACPYTMSVEYANDGAENPVLLPRTPAKPVIKCVVDEKEEEHEAFGQVVQVQLEEPHERVIRYRVTVLHQRYCEELRTWDEVESVHETYDNSVNISVYKLAAGATYRFEVAAINEVGVGEISDPHAHCTEKKVQRTMVVMKALSWTSDLGEDEDGEFPGDGIIEDAFPTWAVGGGEWLNVRIELSTQAYGPLTRVEFQPLGPGNAFGCHKYKNPSLQSVECSIHMDDLLVPDLAGLGAGMRLQLSVTVYDEGGMRVASSMFPRLLPDTTTCSLFELPERDQLCEARIVDVLQDDVHQDPLNQFVTLQLRVGEYVHGAGFRGWQIDAVMVGGAVDTISVMGHPRSVRVGGLRAGETYQFKLRAWHADGTLSDQADPFPLKGHLVRHTMPIITPLIPISNVERNRMPGWRQFQDGLYFVNVVLTQPSPSRIDRVVFTSEDGSASEDCQFYGEKTRYNTTCSIPILRLNKDNGTSGSWLFSKHLNVTVLDATDTVVAFGDVMREAISGEACSKWEPAKPMYCRIGINGLDVSNCVRDCKDCTAGTINTFPSMQTCTVNPCVRESLIFCPGSPQDPCIDRRNNLPDLGCGQFCFGASLAKVTGSGDSYDVCAPPCQPTADIIIEAGKSAVLRCMPTQIYRSNAPSAGFAPTNLTCPHDNTQRHIRDPGTDAIAAWAVGLVTPDCITCDAAKHCNGRAVAVAPNSDQTECVCTCATGYTGAMCESCDVANSYFREPGSLDCVACTSEGACNGHAIKAKFDGDASPNDTCTCVCQEQYAGARCDTCSDDFFGNGYPKCEKCNTCNGHADQIADPFTGKCKCKCKDGFAGTYCQKCALGFGPKYPQCSTSYWVFGSRAVCPPGARPLKYLSRAMILKVGQGTCGPVGGSNMGYHLDDELSCEACWTVTGFFWIKEKRCATASSPYTFKKNNHDGLLCGELNEWPAGRGG